MNEENNAYIHQTSVTYEKKTELLVNVRQQPKERRILHGGAEIQNRPTKSTGVEVKI